MSTHFVVLIAKIYNNVKELLNKRDVLSAGCATLSRERKILSAISATQFPNPIKPSSENRALKINAALQKGNFKEMQVVVRVNIYLPALPWDLRRPA